MTDWMGWLVSTQAPRPYSSAAVCTKQDLCPSRRWFPCVCCNNAPSCLLLQPAGQRKPGAAC